MNKIKINRFFLILSHLKLKDALKLSLGRLYSLNHYYVLKRSLLQPFEATIRTPVTVGRISPEDIREILGCLRSLDGESRKEMISRLLFYKAGFKNCFIARTKNNEIAYLQWLILPSENPVIKKNFSRKFYPLRPGEVMIENAFTFPKFRGLGLLPWVTQKLLMIARESGHTSAITYIRKDKIPSLNEFLKIRFKITKLIKEFRFIGITVRRL